MCPVPASRPSYGIEAGKPVKARSVKTDASRLPSKVSSSTTWERASSKAAFKSRSQQEARVAKVVKREVQADQKLRLGDIVSRHSSRKGRGRPTVTDSDLVAQLDNLEEDDIIGKEGLESEAPFKAEWLVGKPPREWEGDGFDTETYRGWAKLLCTSRDALLVRRGDWEACFEFLLDHGPRLCAWNLRFDAEAVLKHLGEQSLIRLLAVEHLNVGKYTVDLVPWKMLRVSDADRSTEVFDIAPFYGSRLETAANRFLNAGKLKNVDAARLNTEIEYWGPNLDDIIAYCKRDCDLTQRLAMEVSNRFVKLGGDFRKPYSVAFVAADILMRESLIPKLPTPIIPLAEEAFVGARFECLWRGHFEKACSYDIKSAYPGHLLKVEDAQGRWVEGRGAPHKDALHAIIRVEATIKRDEFPYLAPLPFTRKGVITYPTGTFQTSVLMPTYLRFEEYLKPIRSWSFIPTGEVFRPYAKTVQKLLDFRESSDKLLKDAAKRGNNSVYGKLLNQRSEKRLVMDDGGDHWTGRRIVVDGTPYRMERLKKRGLLYHPLHAGLITEACRLQMWEAAQKKPEDVLMIQADGLITASPFLGKAEAKVAGDLGFVAEGEAIVCGSGLYEIKGYARRTRGVMFRSEEGGKGVGKAVKLKGKSWFGLLRGVRTETVQFTDMRPAHLSECLRGARYHSTMGEERKLGLKDANVFLPFTRDLNVCRDMKRKWPDIGQARRLLKEKFRSVPLHIREGP